MFGDKSYLFSSEISRTEKQMNLKNWLKNTFRFLTPHIFEVYKNEYVNKNVAQIFFIIFSPYKSILFLTNHDEYNSS